MFSSPAVRVGIIVFLAIVLFALVYLFLQGYALSRSLYKLTIIFSDAQGLQKDAKVAMAGVQIGKVQSISLSPEQQAEVVVLISRKYWIPEGSKFVLRVGLLVGEKQIDVIPNRGTKRIIHPGATIKGEVPTRIEDLLPKAEVLLSNLTSASQGINRLVGSRQAQERLNRVFANLESASAKLDRTMTVIEGTTSGQQENVKTIVTNIRVASENVRAITDDLLGYAKRGELQENIGATLASARRASESLEHATASLDKLVSNPQTSEDLRATVSGARKTVEEAQAAFGRINQILGVKKPGTPGAKGKPGITSRGFKIDGLYRPADTRFRADISATLGLGAKKSLDLGVYDFGGSNRLILQSGSALGPSTNLRYGIYAGKLGVGLDQSFSPSVLGTLNLYNPDDPRLDLETEWDTRGNWNLLLGVDKLFKDNQVTVGARLRR